jgi:hypothetical protein
MKAQRNADARALSAYLEGEVTASERAAIEVELENSAEARRTLAQIRNLTAQLAAPAPELESIDLAARVRAAVRTPVAFQPRKRNRALVCLLGLAACLAAVLLYVNRPSAMHGALAQNTATPEASEFHAKSNGTPLGTGRRWAGIQAYRVVEHGVPEPLQTELTPKDGLLFSYTNLGSRPFDYLMIFAVDSRNDVHWFYPAYEAAGENPESIRIAHGRANVPLGDLVQQDFAAGPLALYALFTRRPFNVSDVEAWVQEHGRPAAESPPPGGSLQRIDTRVAR